FYFAGDGNSPLRVVYTENPNQLRSSLLYPMTAEGAWDGLRNIAVEEIWIDGLMPSKSIDLLQSQIRKAHERLLDFKRYDAEVLYKVSDFRRLVNLLYIIRLSEKMGISTRLDPVLSFPLGANSISILEAALAYHTLVTGKIYPLGDEKKSSMVPIITKMVDRESNTIWEYSTQPKNILSKRVSGQVSEILRLVVENGTGRGAKDAVHLIMDFENEKIEIPIPSLGKTGTANRFTNSSFVGIIPGATGESSELGLERGYVIASYIGYDDNRPMKGKQIAIYGASGALPLWIDTVNTIVNSPAYKKGVQVADLAFNAQSFQMVATKGLHPVSVSPTTGLPPEYHKPNPPPNLFQVLADGSVEGETLVLKRAFEPLRGVYDEKK
ncbi:MAG: penicillin-binding transpeptidase domain-containing protein, partial [Desulfobacteraceae bacterium]